MSLKGKVALITGGAKSPCAERARQLAKEGANLALHYSSPKTKTETLNFRDEMAKAHSSIKISLHAGELSTAAAVEQLFTEAISAHKKVDIVVNTLGTVLRKPVADVSAAEYDKMFAYAVFIDEQRRRTVDQLRAEDTRTRRSGA